MRYAGNHQATIDDIVAQAGVARRTFYLYFENKHGRCSGAPALCSWRMALRDVHPALSSTRFDRCKTTGDKCVCFCGVDAVDRPSQLSGYGFMQGRRRALPAAIARAPQAYCGYSKALLPTLTRLACHGAPSLRVRRVALLSRARLSTI
ncbi:MAG: helix-turn-helix domain-containing protein [Myxococcales bacterium]